MAMIGRRKMIGVLGVFFKMTMKQFFVTTLIVTVIGVWSAACAGRQANIPAAGPADSGAEGVGEGWSQAEVAVLRSLWIESLSPLPPDPSNAVGDDAQAAALGHQFFFDKRFSANGEVSCATCHKPEEKFTDSLPRAEAIGTTDRGTPTIIGAAYSPWFFWDGRRDSQWSQALTPMESHVEHGGTRLQYAQLIADDEAYQTAYEEIFGALPDLSDESRFPERGGPLGNEAERAAWEEMTSEDQHTVNQIYANIGKAVAAYERLIVPGPARFDDYVAAMLEGDTEQAKTILTPDEEAGLKLFISEQAQCIRCHNGPLFTSNSFHNIGVMTASGLALDYGRLQGAQEVLENEFNCLGDYSDAEPDQCVELRFIKTSGVELPGAFKVPTLRNVAETAPYMQSGQILTLAEVLQHYNKAEPGPLGHNELNPLNLSETQLKQLEAFLGSLTSPVAVDPMRLNPPEEAD